MQRQTVVVLVAGALIALSSIPASAQTWNLAWSDEFNGSGAVSGSNWTYDVGGGGWGNAELEYYQSGSANVGSSFGGYHTYAITWDANAITGFYDGVNLGAANIQNNINSTEEFHKSFFILLNLAVGGSWPGNPDGTAVFPANLNVDYVRY